MTVREMYALINKSAGLHLDSLTIRVRILDVRTRFGISDVLVTPESGSGQKWVQLDRLSVAN